MIGAQTRIMSATVLMKRFSRIFLRRIKKAFIQVVLSIEQSRLQSSESVR